ncbi:1-(5-phosphoribosyl)-5-[(5-phosphoribosylamino)methylideneamino]imidazole-4-carboxamide isomerase [Belnapia rosea]|uniref:1-(5-phosphoribosyl)-5-[(5- phosphoribosylamino)methylideneamino]imidazole-4- carboxamide isomerase n=1 Tax=Belnapia rosea TaxID=938405 RepID=UPI0008875CDE|nr:1-(5-phosphoribosyl)-5-[(5-phosphoribosylamino)methylideneamino]imidazole-4-carboxamide isomerase [Belnapia rosea]SDB33806.1 1-(5-phosphoribosyl)-5-[(5-phosphoribosylamino)methylideneamino] imidazole-4-carboxamide isomerase [Belnapia rosea]
MGLTLYPAIDLKAGQVVRLKRGDMREATVYSADPAAQARLFAAAGFRWLHVVDLDGAFAGRPANASAVQAILAATPGLPVQLGGGIRSMGAVEGWLDQGVKRVILGSAALKDPQFALAACRAWPGQIAVGIDARGGMVATEGWADISTMTAGDLARRFEDAGAAAIIYTDIDRDGMLGGVNLEATLALARSVRVPVIASGGVASLNDLASLTAVTGEGIEGVIIGRALYDGRIDPTKALALVSAVPAKG